MNFMFIGGPTDYGDVIINKFNADYFSRRNGFDIDLKEIREYISKKSLEYDAILLHTYTSPINSQLLLLEHIYQNWEKNEKIGNILVTGSIASYYENYKNAKYTADKKALDFFVKSQAKKCNFRNRFKITNLRVGMLDNEESKKKPHFEKGISAEQFCNCIQFILQLPADIIIPEIVIESAYE